MAEVANGLSPNLGSYDYSNTNKLLATAGNSPQALSQTISNAQGMQTISSQQLQLGHQRLSALNDVVSSVMADPTPENASARITDAIRQGVIRPEDGARELSQIAALGNDPNKIRQYAFQHGQQIASIQQRMEAAGMGAPQLVSNGQEQVPVVAQGGLHPAINPAGGPPIQMQQSPSELAAPTDWTDAQGVKHQGTRQQFLQATGDTTGGVAGAPGKAYVDKTTGKIVYPGAAPVGTGIAGPAPGIVGAADTTAKAGADMGTQIQTAGNNQETRATLSNLQDELGKIATGPNAETWNTVKAGVNGVLDIANAPEGVRFDRDRIAAAEKFRKGAEMLAQQQQASLGGTDAALSSGRHSNPNLDLSTLGNKQVLAMLQGNQDALTVRAQEYRKWLDAGNSPANTTSFLNEFNKTFSPRAFQFSHMEPAERADMLKNMSPQDRAALASALAAARQNGWIRPNGG